MKIKYFAAFMLVAFLLTSLPFSSLMVLDASAAESLGTITECIIDRSSEKIMIRGSIKHSVLVDNRDGKIAVYRFDPWINALNAVKTATPLATMDMTIRFEFDLPCTAISHRMSVYAVAIISSSGAVSIISDPQYADLKTSDTSSSGFKAVITDDVAGATSSHPGSAIIDVYLDKLDKGNKSGYIFNADGELFYFDRDVIKELDKKVMSYTASGADVYFRFLISPYVNDLPFCTKGNLWAANKCVVINNRQALNAIYAYTYFLISRYDGADYGQIDGIILGKGADMPILYNYASLVSENYEDVYARSLTLIGLAALEAAGDSNISLIVPVGDTLSDTGAVYASDFLSAVADYVAKYSELTFTVMCESRHNPYKITDSLFATEIEPEDTTDDTYYQDPEGTVAENPDTSIPEEITADNTFPITEETELIDPVTEETHDESIDTDIPVESTFPDDTTSESPEKPKPEINTDADGYYCTDNIGVFINMFNKLKKNYSSVNDGFAWCWYPGADTVEGALGVCYAYNYMKLAYVGADFYAICFENEVAERFSSISHLFKYIDTSANIKETAYARSVFEITDWSEIIPGFKEGTGVFNDLHENSLEPNVGDYTGSIVYFDYSSGKGTGGWFAGLYCNSLAIQTENGTSFLQADMDLDAAGVNQAEIGYLFDRPEPLLLGDALTFEIKCGEDDGSLYEVAVCISCGNSTVVSRTVITGGVKCALSVNVSDRDDTAGVQSMKITLKRVTGSGGCKMNLYRVLVNSASASDGELEEKFENIRDYLRADTSPVDDDKMHRLLFGIVLLSAVGLVALFMAYGNDRRRYTADNSPKDEKKKHKRGNE